MNVPIKTKRGDTMPTNPNYAIYDRAQRTHDVLIVTSVAMWATLIGFAPVVAIRFFMV